MLLFLFSQSISVTSHTHLRQSFSGASSTDETGRLKRSCERSYFSCFRLFRERIAAAWGRRSGYPSRMTPLLWLKHTRPPGLGHVPLMHSLASCLIFINDYSNCHRARKAPWASLNAGLECAVSPAWLPPRTIQGVSVDSLISCGLYKDTATGCHTCICVSFLIASWGIEVRQPNVHTFRSGYWLLRWWDQTTYLIGHRTSAPLDESETVPSQQISFTTDVVVA